MGHYVIRFADIHSSRERVDHERLSPICNLLTYRCNFLFIRGKNISKIKYNYLFSVRI